MLAYCEAANVSQDQGLELARGGRMISVLLPTIRPHLITRAVQSIGPAAAGVPYEVVVVADFDADLVAIGDPNVRWLISRRYGVIDAINVAQRHARGEYLFVFNDESVLEPGALRRLYETAQQEPKSLLSPRHLPPFNFSYYGKPFAAFPFVHRDVVAELGGLFDPTFKGFYADPDFSLRAHAKGVPIRIVDDAVLRHANNHDEPHHASVSAYLEQDRAVFRSRWDHLGEFRDP